MNVTIKDIAKIANVSHTTVSRALNNSPFINEDTKERILEIAKQLNYTPNYSAKSLVLNRSYNIGLFFSTITKGTSPHFFYEVVKGVNHIIKDQYNLIVKGIDDYDPNLISKHNFDGIIIMSQSTKDDLFIKSVIDKKIPIVVLNREVQSENIINILSDDKMGAYKAVDYLVKNGHKRIALIEGQEGFKSAQERKEGYINALIDNNIPVNEKYLIKGNYDSQSGYKAAEILIREKEKPTAIFCSNDDMAVGAMKALKEAKVRIPEDISLIGFDDNIFASFLTPALTTVKRPIEKISQAGASMLIDLINDIEISGEISYIKTELILRNSVKSV